MNRLATEFFRAMLFLLAVAVAVLLVYMAEPMGDDAPTTTRAMDTAAP